MRDITQNEMRLVLYILKSPEKLYNASNLSRLLGISVMGASKIAKKLEKDGIITATEHGKAIFYKINTNNDYTRSYVKFLLQGEAEQSPPYIKRWITEVKKIIDADVIILFGSVLITYEGAKDIDVLLITDKKRFSKVKTEVEGINLINIKKLHPIYQTKEDLKENIKKRDKVIINAIKGVVVSGEEIAIQLLAI